MTEGRLDRGYIYDVRCGGAPRSNGHGGKPVFTELVQLIRKHFFTQSRWMSNTNRHSSPFRDIAFFERKSVCEPFRFGA